MVKNEVDLRTRLQQSALALFREQGYDQTTAAQIAARAGATERTFFRHFPDKREVLFEGEQVLRAALVTAIDGAPAGLGPLETLFYAFRSTVPLLEANRPFSKPRHDIIAATPALYERELAKLAALTRALADALQARGVDPLPALLAAQTGMAAFAQATVAWLEQPGVGLEKRIELAWEALKGMLGGAAAAT